MWRQTIIPPLYFVSTANLSVKSYALILTWIYSAFFSQWDWLGYFQQDSLNWQFSHHRCRSQALMEQVLKSCLFLFFFFQYREMQLKYPLDFYIGIQYFNNFLLGKVFWCPAVPTEFDNSDKFAHHNWDILNMSTFSYGVLSFSLLGKLHPRTVELKFSSHKGIYISGNHLSFNDLF